MKGAKQKEVLAEIGEEIENIRISWRWAISQKNTADVKRMLKSLGRFYRMYSWFQEGVEAFERAITNLQETDTAQDQALLGQLLATRAGS